MAASAGSQGSSVPAGKVAIRSRRIGGSVYVRQDDLIRWFAEEAKDARKLGRLDVGRLFDVIVDRVRRIR